MKKVTIALIVIGVLFTLSGCVFLADELAPYYNSLTIKNDTAYTLENVRWNGHYFPNELCFWTHCNLLEPGESYSTKHDLTIFGITTEGHPVRFRYYDIGNTNGERNRPKNRNKETEKANRREISSST